MKRCVPILVLITFALGGCFSNTYYAGMEKLGYEKREILSDRVENARESQQEAKEQFSSALERYKSVINVDGGDLEDKYDTLSAEYETSYDMAEDVRDRIAKVEDVAGALFAEWKEEVKQISNPNLRSKSSKKFSATKNRYDRLISAMKRASSKMDPILTAFKDQVLYLKHNLNAKAIDALEGELATIQSNVGSLIKEMEKSIAEADAFIKTLDE